MQNILITGTSGFIGGRFLQQTLKNKWFGDATIYILSSQNKSIPGCKTIIYQTHNFSESIFPKNIIFDCVFHIGAFIPKNGLESNHPEHSTSNIIFTQSLLNALSSKCKKIIFLSTIDIYSTSEIINEKTPVEPASLYGYSKLYCEKLVEAWATQEKCSWQILRIGHIYGPGETAYRKVIPVTIQNILNNKRPEIWGDGNEKRAFLYIDDCTKFIYKSSLLNDTCEIINITSGNSLAIKDLIAQIINLCNKDIEILQHPSSGLTRSLVFDNQKMIKLLGKEEVPIIDGLKAEIDDCLKLQKCGKI
jgi:UDP-glucose 4-epimerase